MDKKTMIDAIYEKIADKTLNRGCMFLTHHKWSNMDWTNYDQYCKWYISENEFDDEDGYQLSHDCGLWWSTLSTRHKSILIWHPISLARLINYISKNKHWFQISYYARVCIECSWWPLINWECAKEDWTDAILDDQSDETIETIYNLLCN